MDHREKLRDKKRIVVKIGSSSLTHQETGDINFQKIEHLARVLADIRGMGKDVILVTSGSIAVGRQVMKKKPASVSEKQALAAVGQARLIMAYQRIFSEYNQTVGQVLMTKNTMVYDLNRRAARNTFEELLNMGVIPIVNENDTISTYEIQFGDNDRLSAIVAALVGADCLILLSDIDGMYTDDPRKNPDAKLIDIVEDVDDRIMGMGKGAGSDVGTGGMNTKLLAAKIASASGADMVIMNGSRVDEIMDVLDGRNIGTLFTANKRDDFRIIDYLSDPQ
ncbi:MAG: glutamate 5-kinase [Lachnospiraceae bacterium]|nr:glutamate 5-kinase [Lachnospiraceae bacterium]